MTRREKLIHKFLSTFYLLPRYQIKKPVFIIAPPRSGSSFLFESLSCFKEFCNLKVEADTIWWKYFPYEKMEHPSDVVEGNAGEAQTFLNLKRELYAKAVRTYFNKENKKLPFSYKYGLRSIRYLDKTIAHVFHLDYLNKHFPDAQYIFLVRHPYPNVNSMIEGWGNKNFYKPQLKKYIDQQSHANVDNWTYPAPAGWLDQLDKEVPEICAWIWKMHIDYALKAFEKNKIKPIFIKYEDLKEDSLRVVKEQVGTLGVEFKKEYEAVLKKPPLSRTTLSKPDDKKWEKNLPILEQVTDIFKSSAEKIGYSI